MEPDRLQLARWRRSRLALAVVGGLLGLPGAAMAQAAYQEAGRVGDTSSWHSAEYKADWGLGALHADAAYARGLTGRGIAVGLVDNGVAMSHSEFRGRGHVALHLGQASCGDANVLVFRGAGRCFASDGDQPKLDVTLSRLPGEPETTTVAYNNHGTHVGGTMVASRDGSGMHGVAFGAGLVSARYYGDRLTVEGADSEGVPEEKQYSQPSANTAALVSDLYQQMHDKQVRVLNFEVWRQVRAKPASANTVTALRGTYEGSQAFVDAMVDASIKHGIVTVVAAGNDEGRIANLYPSLPVFRPEAEAHWLSVVNVDAQGKIHASSSICAQTKAWCVAAPGTDIYSTDIKDGVSGRVEGKVDIAGSDPIRVELTRGKPALGYTTLTGTSMAAPHAIGALALVMERYPYLTAMQARDVLLTTAKDLGAPGVDEVYGWGLIDLQKGMQGYGQLRVDTEVVMDRRAGGAKVWAGEAWDEWNNDIGGSGHLRKSGAGWLRLSGNNRFAGATVSQGVLEFSGDSRLAGAVKVDGGEWRLGGTLRETDVRVQRGLARIDGVMRGGQLRVDADGRVEGSGTLATTDLAGTLAPAGGAIGTLRVQGDYVQRDGAIYEANVGAQGQSDRVAVEGRATLEGGFVDLVPVPGQYLLGQRFTLLTASEGVRGEFDGIAHPELRPFLSWQLRYAPTAVQLEVGRGRALADAAITANQRAVARAIDHAPQGAALAGMLTQLHWEQAAPALDSLGGELHASTHSALLQMGTRVGNVAADRARFAQDEFSRQASAEGREGLWVDLAQAGGQLRDGSGNAADLRYQDHAQLLGYDHRFGEGTLLGVMGGIGRGDARVSARASRSDINSRYLGVYGGQRWGGFGLRGGVLQARQSLRTQRETVIDSFHATARARYGARSLQLFAEGGYQWQGRRWDLEPYLQWAQLRQHTAAFEESGGVHALALAAADQRLDLYTAGARASLQLGHDAQQASWLSLRGGLAYRRAQGDLHGIGMGQWRGGEAFAVAGAPLAAAVTVLDLGISARVSRASLLELGYSGQFHGQGREDQLNLRYSLQF